MPLRAILPPKLETPATSQAGASGLSQSGTMAVDVCAVMSSDFWEKPHMRAVKVPEPGEFSTSRMMPPKELVVGSAMRGLHQGDERRRPTLRCGN
jgi:hypothetical protein